MTIDEVDLGVSQLPGSMKISTHLSRVRNIALGETFRRRTLRESYALRWKIISVSSLREICVESHFLPLMFRLQINLFLSSWSDIDNIFLRYELEI